MVFNTTDSLRPQAGQEGKMPFYDYECRQCDKKFTRQESFEEHDRRRVPQCPECGSRKTERVLAAAYVRTSKKS